MSTTKQRSSSKERFWRTMVRRWRRSGLSIREFCAEQQIAEPSFYAWRRTIARRDAEATSFVPVRVVPDERSGPNGDKSGGGLELVLRAGRLLRIGPGFDTPTLQRLLAVLEEQRP